MHEIFKLNFPADENDENYENDENSCYFINLCESYLEYSSV